MELIGIKYTGRKAFPRPDNMFGTGLVWETPDSVQYVPEQLAAKFVAFGGVWSLANAEDDAALKKASMTALVQPVKQVTEDVELAPLVQLDSMDDNALREFAQRQFGQKLHPQMTEKNMRTKIRNMMNSPVTG